MDERSLDTRLALQLGVMVQGQLIGPEHLRPWAEAWVLQLEAPPRWILELCTVQDASEAIRILSDFVGSPPVESFDAEERTEAIVACLLLRYQRGDLSWATLLQKTGQTLDEANGRRPCEDVYALLTELENSKDAKALEFLQRAKLEHEFHDALERIESVYRLLVAAT